MNVIAYLAMLVWAAAGAIVPRPHVQGGAAPAAATRGRPRLPALALACAALVLLTWAGLRWMLHGALATPFGAPFGSVPIVVAKDFGIRDAATSDAELAISLLETAALFAVYRALAGRTVTRGAVAIVAATCAALLALAVTSPVANSSDMYAYVAYAHAPLHAYAPAALRSGDAEAAIAAMVNPVPPAVYGPLWIGISALALAPFHGLGAALAALRGLEVAAFLGALLALRRLRAPFAVAALFALDPGILDLWIVDGHNDLFGVALLLAALAFRRRSVRVALVAAAGLVKLPLVVVGVLVFADDPLLRRRAACAAAAVAIAAVLSYAAGGHAYLHQLVAAGGRRRPVDETVFQLACLALEAAAFALALGARRFSGGLSWIWSASAAYPAPWYGIWGLPYALASGGTATFLIAEPAVSFVFSWNYAPTALGSVAVPLLVIAPLAYAVALRIRQRRRERTGRMARVAPAADNRSAWVSPT